MSQPHYPPSYQYPILTLDEMLPIVHEFWPDQHINELDFKKPQADRWQKFYLAMLQSIVGTTADQFIQQQFQGQQAGITQWPELHEECAGIRNFTLALQRFMFATQVKDFNIKDILEPKPKRTIRNVSAIINFYRFHAEKIQVYDQLKLEDVATREQFEVLTEENDELQQRINAIKAKRAEQEPELNQVQSSYEETGKKMNENHKAQTALQKSTSDMKAGIAQKNASIDQQKLMIIAAKEEGEKLSRQIVQSPDRMKSDMERMRNQVSQLKITKDDKYKRLMELQQQKENRQHLENNYKQGLKLIQGISGETDKEREILGEISNIRDKTQTQKDVLRDLTAKDQHLKRMIQSKHEKMSKLTLQHQHKMAAGQETVQQYQQEKDKHVQFVTEDEAQKHVLKQERFEIEQDISQTMKVSQQKIATLTNDYQQILQKLDHYHTNMATAWENISTVMKVNQDI